MCLCKDITDKRLLSKSDEIYEDGRWAKRKSQLLLQNDFERNAKNSMIDIRQRSPKIGTMYCPMVPSGE